MSAYFVVAEAAGSMPCSSARRYLNGRFAPPAEGAAPASHRLRTVEVEAAPRRPARGSNRSRRHPVKEEKLQGIVLSATAPARAEAYTHAAYVARPPAARDLHRGVAEQRIRDEPPPTGSTTPRP